MEDIPIQTGAGNGMGAISEFAGGAMPDLSSSLPPGVTGTSEETFGGPLETRLDHKNWKARKGAYDELKALLATDAAAAQQHSRFLTKAVKDSNASALDAGLECVLEYLKQYPDEAPSLLNGVLDKGMSGRPKTVQIASDILSVVVEEGKAGEMLSSLSALVPKLKAAKHKQQLSAALLKLFEDFGGEPFEASQCIPILVKFLGEADEKVRKAARGVVVCLYRASPSILNILEAKGVKSSTIQESTKECESAPPPTAPIKTVKGAAAVVTTASASVGLGASLGNMLYDDAEPEPVLKHLPKEFYSVITDPKAKWSAKRGMMEESLLPHASKVRLQADDYGDLAKALRRALVDPNIAMTGLACKALLYLAKGLRTSFSREARVIFPVFLDLLKEKKMVVAEPVRDFLFTCFEHTIVTIGEMADDVIKASGDKVILVRLGVLQWMTRCVQSSEERALRALKLFSTVAVKVLENDVDSGVKEAASQLCVALYKTCGEAHCGFLNDINAKARDRILKAASGATLGASVNSMPGGALRRSASTRVPPVRPMGSSSMVLDDDNPDHPPPRNARQPKVGLARTTKPRSGNSLNSSRGAEKAETTGGGGGGGSLPPPFSKSDVEAMLEANAPDSAQNIIKGLASKVFKERLEAVSQVGVALEGMEGGAAMELMTSLFYSATPGWKDPTFQVAVEMVKVSRAALARGNGVPPRVVRAVAPVLEKLQDLKVKVHVRELLTELCESNTPRSVFAEAISLLSSTKSPKAIQEGLDWLAESQLEFGPGSTDEKAVLAFGVKCLECGAASGAQTPAMKNAALKLIGVLARCSGADPVLRVVRDSGALRGDVIKKVEEECEKARASGDVVAKRQAKNAGPVSVGGSLNEPKDIRPLIDSALLDKMSHTNWSERGEALDDLLKIVSRKIKPDVGSDLLPALKQRLADTNRNLVPSACEVVSALFEGMGPACRSHAPRLVPTILNLLGDQKPTVRARARKALVSYDSVCGLEGLLPYLPKAMGTDVPTARKELSEFLVDVFVRDAEKLPQGALQTVLQPLISFIQDKHPTTRKHAEELLKPVVENVGYDVLAKHIGDLNAANQRALQPILEKNKQFSREPQQKPAKRPRLAAPRHAEQEDEQRAMPAPEPMSIDEDPPKEYQPKLGFKAVTRDASMHQDMPAVPDLAMQTPMIPRQQTTIASIAQAVDMLNSPDMNTCLVAAERIVQEHRAGATIPVDQVMLKAIARLTTICTDDSVPLDVKGSKELVGFMTLIFQPPLSLRCKTDTIYYLIGALLDNLLTEKLHVTYRTQSMGDSMRQGSDDILRSLNSLMLKLLERSSRTETFTALLRRLDRYNKLIYAESSRYIKYVELVAKCLLKLIRFIANENATSPVDFTLLLSAVHEFLTENPPTNFKGKMELPLRTVKTLLNELVKIRGESIRDCLVELNISNTALISEFIAMCLMKSHEDGSIDQSASFSRLPSVGGPPAQIQHHRDPMAEVQKPQPPTAAAAAAARGGNVSSGFSKKMDEIFLRVRKTDTSREGVRELYLLMQANPTLDITPWLTECSAPFQGFLQRQLSAHAAAEREGASAPTSGNNSLASSQASLNASQPLARTYSGDSMTTLRERMNKVRAARQAS